ncbi:MAG: transposase domain-containing protein [Labilithrix sp.]
MGSDDHAHAAANIFSLVASCQLHNLDVERYLADVIRVMPYWPRDRYLDLALPKYWLATRARLDKGELKLAIGHAKQADGSRRGCDAASVARCRS